MTKSVQKLFISILSLIFAVALFGTVSYAWFSISTTGILHNVTLNIQMEGSFQISLDGVNYYDKLTYEDIMRYIDNDIIMIDVTTSDGKEFLTGGPMAFEPAVRNVDYLQLTLYFRTTAPERNVYLVDNVSTEAYLDQDIDGTYIISRGINWEADSTFLNGPDPEEDMIYAGDRYMFYGAEATRISFLEKKIQTNINDTRDEQDLNFKIFDLSRFPERGYGATYGSLAYYNSRYEDQAYPPEDQPVTTTNFTEFSQYNPFVPLDDNSFVLRMIETSEVDSNGKTYYVGMAEMSIWLEGWDADCYNAIMADLLIIKLTFKAARDIR